MLFWLNEQTDQNISKIVCGDEWTKEIDKNMDTNTIFWVYYQLIGVILYSTSKNKF